MISYNDIHSFANILIRLFDLRRLYLVSLDRSIGKYGKRHVISSDYHTSQSYSLDRLNFQCGTFRFANVITITNRFILPYNNVDEMIKSQL